MIPKRVKVAFSFEISPFLLLLLLLLVGKSLAEKTEAEWKESFELYIEKFGKVYASQEEKDRRFSVYVERMSEVQKLNSDGTDSARYGETRFSDLSKEEFAAIFPAKMGVKTVLKEENVPVKKLPDNVTEHLTVTLFTYPLNYYLIIIFFRSQVRGIGVTEERSIAQKQRTREPAAHVGYLQRLKLLNLSGPSPQGS